MTGEEIQQRESVIAGFVQMMRTMPFTVEFKVKKKPAGIKIIYELTQEHMNQLVQQAREKEEKKQPR